MNIVERQKNLGMKRYVVHTEGKFWGKLLPSGTMLYLNERNKWLYNEEGYGVAMIDSEKYKKHIREV